MKPSFLFITLFTVITAARAQRSVTLDLESTIALATDSSLTAEQFRNELTSNRMAYLVWEAGRKPQISLESTPLEYERYMVQRYLSNEDRDAYREQQMIFSEAAVSLTQDIEALGGQLYAITGLGLLHTFGSGNDYNQFASIPIKLGYRQELLGFNQLKWNSRLQPLQLKKAEKEFAYRMETTAEEAVNLFFQLALTQDQMMMAEENRLTADTIYAIGCRRFKIAGISKAELSILDLQRSNATISLDNARIARNEAMKRLASYLGLEKGTEIRLNMPSMAGPVKVEAEEAMRMARENNPAFVESQQAVEEARMAMEKARVERRLNLKVDASVGLNQVADNFRDAYRRPIRQEQASVTLSVPLKDWGKGRYHYQQAKSQLEQAENLQRQTIRDTEMDVALSVDNCNQRHQLTHTARQALNIAQEAYDAMLARFIKGQATVNDLSLAQNYWQTARQNYTQSLQLYWMAYYQLRRLTLYDFNNRQPILHRR